MSDNASSNNKTPATIFYAQKTDVKKDSNRKPYGKRNDNQGKPKYQGDKRQGDKYQGEKYQGDRKPRSSADSDSRIETFKPRAKGPNRDRDVSPASSSPWKSRVRNTEQLPSFDEAVNQESDRDLDLLKRQRKEETYVYGENSCKAVFKHRPNSVVKAFFTQPMTYTFKNMIAWLVENRLGYDVISDEQMAKVTQTPHHGGVCLIIKKRQASSLTDYLANNKNRQQDCVLAIDDVNNPHNLGGMVRTAAFFNVNGILLRHPAMLESGAALRVAEGGAESLTPIKSDDFVVSLEQLKQQGYQIVALLPCKAQSIESEALAKVKIAKKVAFVIFQQINPKLAQCADKVVYLEGSESMAALNISVLTGILLAQWQGKSE